MWQEGNQHIKLHVWSSLLFAHSSFCKKLCSPAICNPRVSKWCCNSLTSLCVLSFFSKSIKIWTFSCWKMATALTKSPTTRTWIWSHPNQSTLPACAARQPPLPPVKYSNSAFPAFCPPPALFHTTWAPLPSRLYLLWLYFAMTVATVRPC